MSIDTLFHVSKDIIDHQIQTGQNALNAWRTLGQRLPQAVHSRVANAVQGARLPMISDEMKSSVVASHAKVTALLTAAMSLPATRGTLALDRLNDKIDQRFDRFVDLWNGIEQPMAKMALNTGSQALLPVARLSQKMAALAEAQTRQLGERLAPRAQEASDAPAPKKPASTRRKAATAA